MLPIFYHDPIGSDRLDVNIRIDPLASGYVLRAATIMVKGKTYSLPEDVTFPDLKAPYGTLWTKDGKTVQLAAFDSSLLPQSSDQQVRELFYADMGTRVCEVFRTVLEHYDLQTKKMTVGPILYVSRSIRSGQTPADQVAIPAGARPTVAAYVEENSKSLQRARTLLTGSLTSPLTSAQGKTWEQLNDEERQAVQKKMAEKLGLVRAS
jgi:hypothetical protein